MPWHGCSERPVKPPTSQPPAPHCLSRRLMQPPMPGVVVLGVDPAFRTGCKLAVCDATGEPSALFSYSCFLLFACEALAHKPRGRHACGLVGLRLQIIGETVSSFHIFKSRPRPQSFSVPQNLTGKVLETGVVYPHPPAPEGQRQQAGVQLAALIHKHGVQVRSMRLTAPNEKSGRLAREAWSAHNHL